MVLSIFADDNWAIGALLILNCNYPLMPFQIFNYPNYQNRSNDHFRKKNLTISGQQQSPILNFMSCDAGVTLMRC